MLVSTFLCLVGCGGGTPSVNVPHDHQIPPVVLVTSTPGGAKIFLNGVDTGAYAASSGDTPTRIELPQFAASEGVCLVTLRLDGYYEWNIFVMVMPSSVIRVNAELMSVESAPANGVVRITSEPHGAEIFIDGKPTGKTTPAELTGLSPTRHAIKVELSGVGEVYDFIDVKPDEVGEVHVTFDEPGRGSVSGVVYNSYGDTMLDAEVRLIQDGRVLATTRTTLFGTFIFRNVTPGRYKLQALAEFAGGRLVGERDGVIVMSGKRTFNADVTVLPEGTSGGIYGVVRDRDGKAIKGAYVFTLIGILSAVSDVTDEQGRYRLGSVLAGSNVVEVVADGYLQARQQVNVEAGKDVRLDFTLTNISAEPGLLPKPQELYGSMFTYPASVGRGINDGGRVAFLSFLRRHKRFDLIKVLEQANTARSGNRLPPRGWIIEADLWWMPTSREDIVGYVIYRSYAQSGGFTPVATVRGTSLSVFVDISDHHTPLKPVRYAYALLSALGKESELSNEVMLIPLGKLRLASPQNDAIVAVSEGEQVVFEWHQVEGAVAYWVQLFAEFPSGPVDPWWEITVPLKETKVTYDGQPLLRGKTYYWMAIAADSENPKIAKAFSYSELRRLTVK